MEIKKVSIIGLGALGVLVGHRISKHLDKENLRIIADKDRIARYMRDNVYCNGERCNFQYTLPDEICEPADLVIFAVKFRDLSDAIYAVKNQVGEQTIIISLLNGIVSETIIGQAYSMDRILYCVAQGMDAVKEGNKLTYSNEGILCIGDTQPGRISEKVKNVADFFEKMEIPYEIDTNMKKRLWGKFMLNVGINQTVSVFGSNYGDVQKEGKARDIMISAMKEVIALSEKADVFLNEEDLRYWLKVADSVSPDGKPSMRQDVEAKRFSEVDLFAGTVLNFGEKYEIPTPVNKMLYEKIKAIESQYNIQK
ncbi:MAG: ketopantoate reductase family protein [Clostridiales bacterium]|nr:ketopantoate reductase family protein [Clostridiales bacterium]